MVRKILVAGLALTPVAAILDWVVGAGDVPLFCVSALALIPLAWLIGEATEQAAEHTGPTLGGLLNASFGNAPELIIALFAISDGLPDVVRGSITGSVVSTSCSCSASPSWPRPRRTSTSAHSCRASA